MNSNLITKDQGQKYQNIIQKKQGHKYQNIIQRDQKKKRRVMLAFYAVKIGRVPGVYKSWEEANKQVLRFSGAICKKFSNQAQARAFAKSSKPTLSKKNLDKDLDKYWNSNRSSNKNNTNRKVLQITLSKNKHNKKRKGQEPFQKSETNKRLRSSSRTKKSSTAISAIQDK